MNGNILNSKGVHVAVVTGHEVFSLRGQKLYVLRGVKIYKLNGDLVGHLSDASGVEKHLDSDLLIWQFIRRRRLLEVPGAIFGRRAPTGRRQKVDDQRNPPALDDNRRWFSKKNGDVRRKSRRDRTSNKEDRKRCTEPCIPAEDSVNGAEGEGKIMALRDPAIPDHRERSTLQLMKHGNWVVRSDLYPAGNATIANLVRKGWNEQGVNPRGARQFRITPAGRTAQAARIRWG